MSSLFYMYTILFCSTTFASMESTTEWTLEHLLKIRFLNTLSFVENGKFAIFEAAALDLDCNSTLLKSYIKNMSTGVRTELTYKGKAIHQLKIHANTIGFMFEKDGIAQIFSGVLRDGTLTGVQQRTNSNGPIIDWNWSRTGKYIAYSSALPKQNEFGIESVGYAQATRLFVVDMNGTSRQLPISNTIIHTFDWSVDDKKIVYDYYPLHQQGEFEYDEVYMENHYDISEINIENGAIQSIAQSPNGESTPHYSHGGKTIAYVASETTVQDEMSKISIVLYDTGTQKKTFAPATPNDKPDLLGWNSNDSALYFSETDSVGRSLYRLTIENDMAVEKILFVPSLMPHFLMDYQGENITYIHENAQTPPELWQYGIKTSQKKQITNINAPLRAMKKIRTEVISWRASDNTRIEGILVYPAHFDPAELYPLIVNVHGGPANNTVNDFFNPLVDPYPTALLSKNNIFVLKPNIRGSDGYGAGFRQANVGDLGGADLQDIFSGIDFLIQKGLVNPDKLGIMGWSYGGFITAQAITQTKRFKAACVGAGPSNWVSITGVTDVASTLENYMEGDIWHKKDDYIDKSPLFYADRVTTPTLIIHGQEDSRVPYSQGLELYNALHKNGVYVKMFGYPRSGHNISEPRLKMHYMNEVLTWFIHYLKDT